MPLTNSVFSCCCCCATDVYKMTWHEMPLKSAAHLTHKTSGTDDKYQLPDFLLNSSQTLKEDCRGSDNHHKWARNNSQLRTNRFFFFFFSPPLNFRRGSACERLWVAAKSCALDNCDRVSQHSTRSSLYFWSGRGQRARRNYEDGIAAVTLYKWRARTSSVIFRVRYAGGGVRIRWASSSQGCLTCRARAEPRPPRDFQKSIRRSFSHVITVIPAPAANRWVNAGQNGGSSRLKCCVTTRALRRRE